MAARYASRRPTLPGMLFRHAIGILTTPGFWRGVQSASSGKSTTAISKMIVDSHLGLAHHFIMMPLPIAVHQSAECHELGLRMRKKQRTRLTIQDAALDLFAEQGYEATTIEHIASRADVSTSTFFRYFGTKADIILNDQEWQLPHLCSAIRDLPSGIGEFEAVRRALQAAWVPGIDAARTIRTVRAVAQSAFLRGQAYDIGVGWMEAVAATLVERRGEPEAMEECLLIARTTLGVFGTAAGQWAAGGATEDFGALIDRGFGMVARMCRGYPAPR